MDGGKFPALGEAKPARENPQTQKLEHSVQPVQPVQPAQSKRREKKKPVTLFSFFLVFLQTKNTEKSRKQGIPKTQNETRPRLFADYSSFSISYLFLVNLNQKPWIIL